MIVAETFIGGLYTVTSQRFEDERGSLIESYVESEFRREGLNTMWSTDVVSTSIHPRTVRGIHYQVGDGDLSKLVRVLHGAAFDVVVDLRRDSETFGLHYSCTLRPNGSALVVPPGCGHGFLTLSAHTMLGYKMSRPFMPDLYRGVHWNSAALDIAWPNETDPVIISAQDASWPAFEDADLP
jgi:dTDP-4-dehydrorhamnose 3,5-epimerase